MIGRKLRDRYNDLTTVVWIIGAVLVVAGVFVAFLGARATIEWRRNATAVVERQAEEIVTLLVTALTRDMRGAQESILMPLPAKQVILDPPYDISETVAEAFARFPYPESFFAWKAGPTDAGSAVLFNRADRPPAWETAKPAHKTFPVTVLPDSAVARRLSSLAHDYVSPQDQFAVFQTAIGGSPYQVIARLFSDGQSKRKITAVVGFTVNLEWVTTAYFPKLIGEVERIGGRSGPIAFSLSIVDQTGNIVTQTRPPHGNSPVRDRQFLLAFYDASNLSIGGPDHVAAPTWTARANTADDPLLGAADLGAKRTFVLIVFATAVSIVALLLAMHLLRSNFELMKMKSDLIATVSHELKTPLAGITLIGEALLKGRSSAGQVTDYAALLSKETTRLNRLVEKFLTFSRIADSKKNYKMAAVDIRELLDESLSRLEPQLREGSFDLKCHLSHPLPHVYCDQNAILQVFENLLENAIKYSDKVRKIEVGLGGERGKVIVSIRDTGKGILPEDIPHVFDRFFRGKNSGFQGSGLGLAIARKIVEDHAGHISIESAVGVGTVVTVSFPAAMEVAG